MREDLALCLDILDLREYASAYHALKAETGDRPAPAWAVQMAGGNEELIVRAKMERRKQRAAANEEDTE